MKLIAQFIGLVFLAAFTVSASAEDEVVSCGDSSIEVVIIQEYEDTTALVRVRDNENRLLVPQIRHPGTFLSLCTKGRFLLIDNSVHYAPSQSFLMSSNGSVIKRFDLGEVIELGKSENEEVFWVQRFGAKEGRPVILLRVFDANGDELLERAFDAATTFEIENAGKKYQVEIMEPSYPG